MTLRKKYVGYGLLCVFCSALQAVAHHGLETYDTSRVIELKGKVVGFKLQEPHSLLFVDVEDKAGNVTSWAVEGGAARGIMAAGLSKEFLASGPNVSVRGYQSKDKSCQPACRLSGQDFDFAGAR